MKLNLFSRWKPLGTLANRKLEFKTEKAGTSTFVTLIRDQESGNIVTRGYGRSEDGAQSAAHQNLKRAGNEKILQAIESGKPIGQESVELPKREPEPRKNIQWRDGANQSNKAIKKIVGEQFTLVLDESAKEIFNV